MRDTSRNANRRADTSPAAVIDRSLPGKSDTSPLQHDDDLRRCDWCRSQLVKARADARFCSRRCRQSAFRIRRRRQVETHNSQPLAFAFADPPYPGLAARFYKDQPTFAGEVDHAALIASLVDRYDGWALSTGAYALREVLPLCPAGVRVCAWVKPIGCSSLTFGLHNTWEPLIVAAGRRLRPGKRDWFSAQPARRGGDLPGRKPLAFCAFLFDALGMLPGDVLDDLFPGTGIVGPRMGRNVARSCRRRRPRRRIGQLGRMPDGCRVNRSRDPEIDKRSRIFQHFLFT